MYQYKARVTRVIDGDTFDAEVDLGFKIFARIRFRLEGVDTPELRSKDEKERERAKDVKKFVVGMIEEKNVQIDSTKTGKYGRWLATVFFNSKKISLNKILLRSGYATKYPSK